MFKDRAIRRNTFLHLKFGFDPQSINAYVQGIRELKRLAPRNHLDLFQSPTASEGKEDDGQGRSKLAYGAAGLPQLISEACSKHIDIQTRALNSLTEMLNDPLHYYHAIIDLAIVRRLEEVIFREMPVSVENLEFMESILHTFEILATNIQGAKEMIKRETLIELLHKFLIRKIYLGSRSAKILQLLSAHPPVAEIMISRDYLQIIHDIIQSGCDIEDIYVHLSHLIALAPDCAAEKGFYDILFPRITILDPLQKMILKCFALMLHSPCPQDRFIKADGVYILYEILKNKQLTEDIVEFAVLAMKNITNEKHAIWRCSELWDLPLILIRLAHSKTNPRLQLYSIKVLRQITEMPQINKFTRKTCKKQIDDIVPTRPYVEAAKTDLMKWLRWKSFLQAEVAPVKVAKIKYEIENEEESDDLYDFHNPKQVKDIKAKLPDNIAYRVTYNKLCIPKR